MLMNRLSPFYRVHMEKGKHVAINPPVDVGRRSSGKARNDHIDTHLCCTYCTTDTQATVCRNTCKDCMEMRDITHIMTLNSQPTENETSTATITAVQVATEGQPGRGRGQYKPKTD